MYYVVNLSAREIEQECNSYAGAVTSRRNRDIRDATTNDAYAQRLIVTGLSRDEIDDLLQSDAYQLCSYVAGGDQ